MIVSGDMDECSDSEDREWGLVCSAQKLGSEGRGWRSEADTGSDILFQGKRDPSLKAL